MSLEMAHKGIVPPKKIYIRSFLNSGTLIVIITYLADFPFIFQTKCLSHPSEQFLCLRSKLSSVFQKHLDKFKKSVLYGVDENISK
jgi:hypothetical protein